jgi:hypothetical protein
MTRRRLGSALLTGLAAVLLAGCGGPAGSGATPTTTSSGSSADGGPAPAAGPVDCGRPATRTVHTADELTDALRTATPGAVIALSAGGYAGHFVGTAKGTAAAPITVCGGRDAVLDGGDGGYTLRLDGAAYWQLGGFSVHGGQKGVVVDQGSHDTISGLEISGTQEEGLHLRTNSSDNTVRDTIVHNTGLDQPKFGEGIYVGSAKSNWGRYTGGQPDRSDRNVIEHNTISATTAESVDIKEGTTGGVLRGNSFTGPPSDDSGADSWVNVKGNGWQIVGNTGHTSNGDGFSVHQILDGWGLHNVFSGNTAVVNGPGYGINVTKNKDQNTVSCDNTAQGAAKGLTNTTCTG